MRPSFLMTCLGLAALLVAAEARADDCTRVADALAKGGREKRAALIDVDDPHRATGEPIRVFTPDAYYQTDFKGGFTRGSPTRSELGEIADAVRSGARAGKARCKVVGADTYGGRKVTKIHFNDPHVASEVAEQTVWIEDATGLPLFFVLDGATSGFGWLYGDAVKAPARVH